MSRYLLVNASPRAEGTSAVLAKRMAAQLAQAGHSAACMNLYPHLRRLETVVEAFADADTLVVFGPCYINTYPADTYALLEAIAQTPDACHGQRVYGFIQGGMPYAHTHASGLTALRLFARACGLVYGGGFVMGLGAMLNGQPLEKLINAKAVIRQYDSFCVHVAMGEDSPNEVYEQAQLRLPGFVWRLMAGWMNRRIDREAANWGIPKEKVGACFYPIPEAEA
jgi:hypothetical protein